MRYTVRVKGTADLGEWDRGDVMEGRAGDSIGPALASYPPSYEVDAASTQEAADMARAKRAADETIGELWVLIPGGGADVFDRQAVFLRHDQEAMS